MVILDTWNIWISYANKSLNYKNLKPFKIIRIINNLAHKLDLPQSISGVFLIFYLWLFYLNKSNPLPGQIIPPLSFIWFDKKVCLKKYIAKKFFDSKIDKRKKDPVNSKKKGMFDV